jgi:hypothetical protein
MSLAEFEKGQVWRLCGKDYRIVSVSADEKKCSQMKCPPGDLVRGQMVGSDFIAHGTSRAWERHAERVT